MERPSRPGAVPWMGGRRRCRTGLCQGIPAFQFLLRAFLTRIAGYGWASFSYQNMTKKQLNSSGEQVILSNSIVFYFLGHTRLVQPACAQGTMLAIPPHNGPSRKQPGGTTPAPPGRRMGEDLHCAAQGLRRGSPTRGGTHRTAIRA